MLENGHFGTLVHLKSAIQQAVYWDTSVAVYQEDDLAHANIALSPSLALVSVNHVLQSRLVQPVIVVCRQVTLLALASLAFQVHKAVQLILHTVREAETIVHIARLFELALANELKLISTSLRAEFALVLVIDFGFDGW